MLKHESEFFKMEHQSLQQGLFLDFHTRGNQFEIMPLSPSAKSIKDDLKLYKLWT